MTGRTCVVTGAGSGIGAAVTRQRRATGDTVFGVDLDGTDICADLSYPQERRRVVDEVGTRLDGVDVVVTCAGISAPKPETLSVNYFGVVDLLVGLLPALQASSHPRVVVLGSVAGAHPTLDSIVQACLGNDEDGALMQARRAVDADKGIAIYAASKQALARWVRRTAPTEPWAGHGVILNAVCPGIVLTPMMVTEWADPMRRGQLSEQVPMPLTRNPVDMGQIVRTVDFLTAGNNTAVTGQSLYVDGGADAELRGDHHW